MKHRFLFIMALLLTAASAWADEEPDPIVLTYDATARTAALLFFSRQKHALLPKGRKNGLR